MIKGIKYHFSVAVYYIKLSVLKQLEYSLGILGTIIMIPLIYATGILLLYFMVENYQALGGWTFPQLAFLYGLGYLSHGFMMVFSVQNWWIGSYVIRGEFDRMILRPISVFFQFSVRYFNIIGLMDVVVGITIFLYACRLVEFQWTLINIMNISLIICGATLIRSATFTIFCSSAFWTKRNESIVNLLNDFMERTTLYPISIYPNFIQVILTFIIPIAFISFYPSSYLLDKNVGLQIPINMALWVLMMGLGMFFLSKAVFNLGLKKYESAGS